jgi:hypothetical protein
MQSKRMTWLEISLNTGVGLIGSMIITYSILHFTMKPGSATILVTIACTIWSIVRQYVIRRYFNRMLK